MPQNNKQNQNPYAAIAEADPNAAPPAEDSGPELYQPPAQGPQTPGFLPGVARFVEGTADIYKSEEPAWQSIKQSVAPANLFETFFVQGPKEVYHGVVDPAADIVNRFPESLFGRDTTYRRFFDEPTEREEEKAQAARTPAESIAHTTAGLVPGVGPMLAHFGERAGTGDIGGTAAEAASLYVTPKVVGKVINTPGALKARLQRSLRIATGAEGALREEVTRQAGKYAQESADNLAKRRKAIEANQRARAEQLRKDDLKKIKVGEQNREIEAQNQRAREAVAEQNRVINEENVRRQQERDTEVARRRRTDVQSDQDAVNAQNAAGQLENGLWQDQNRQWNSLKERVGSTVSEPPTEIDSAIRLVEADVLQNMPESLPQLKLIKKVLEPEGQAGAESIDADQIRREVIADFERGTNVPYERMDADIRAQVNQAVNEDINRRLRPPQTPEAGPAPTDVNWEQAQRMKTILDEQIRNRSLNRTYRYALKQVYDAVVSTMGRMAERQGAGAEWRAARDATYKWRSAFHDKGSYGKALLEARSIPDVQRVLRRGQSATGNYLSGVFRGFGERGNAAAAAVDAYIQTFESIGREPGKVKITANKAEPEPTPPKPTPEVFPQPPRGPVPPLTPRPVINAAEPARKAIAQTAKTIGKWNARDAGILFSSVALGPWLQKLFGATGQGASNLLPEAAISYEAGKYFTSRFLRRPDVVAWLERTPPEEVAALGRIPGVDKVVIQNLMTQEAIASARTGRIVSLTNAAKEFLGDKNVRLILAAQASGVRTPGEGRRIFQPPPPLR